MIDFSILTGEPFLEAALIATLAAYSQYILFRAGVFSVSPVAAMAVGGYTAAYLAVNHDTTMWLAVTAGVALSAVFGVLLGFLVGRLRGAYQAIATLAVVLVVQRVAETWTSVTGGHFGIAGIPVWAQLRWLLLLTVIIIAVVIVYELSPMGRTHAAIRLDEVAAAACGANVAVGGVTAMALSSAIAGLAGAATAGNQFIIDPSGFGFGLAIALLAMTVVGGFRTFTGPLFGVFVVTALPLMFASQKLFASAVVGLVTIVILRFYPRGISAVIPLTSAGIGRLLRRLRRRVRRPQLREVSAVSRPADVDLVADSIARAYGSVRAVAGISLDVAPGQIVGLIGPNGAGKTSVINLIAGVTALDEGTVYIGEKRLDKLPAFRVARAGVTRTFQGCRLFDEFTVEENVLFGATAGRSRGRRLEAPDSVVAAEAMTLAGVIDDRDRLATELPYAHQRRAEIARALAGEPKFLLLDEPAAGMSEIEAAGLAHVLREIASRGVGILVIDHNVSWIFSVCEEVSVQALGEIIAVGPPAVVRADPAVIEAYTGPEKMHVHAAG